MIADERNGGSDEPRRAIGYVQGFSRYSDRVQEEDDQEEGLNNGRSIEEGNRRLDAALPGHPNGDQQATIENEWART